MFPYILPEVPKKDKKYPPQSPKPFWEEDDFVAFVKDKSKSAEKVEGIAGIGGLTKRQELEHRISLERGEQYGNPTMDEFIKQIESGNVKGAMALAEQKRSFLDNVLPHDEQGKMPKFADNVALYDSLYFDRDNGLVVGMAGKNTIPLYFTDPTEVYGKDGKSSTSLRALTDVKTNYPATLTPEFAKELFSGYELYLTQAPEMFYPDPPRKWINIDGETLQKTTWESSAPASHETVRISKDLKNPLSAATAVTFDTTRGIKGGKEGGILGVAMGLGQGVAEVERLVREQAGSLIHSGGTGQKVVGVIGTGFNALVRGIRTALDNFGLWMHTSGGALGDRDVANLLREQLGVDPAYTAKDFKKDLENLEKILTSADGNFSHEQMEGESDSDYAVRLYSYRFDKFGVPKYAQYAAEWQRVAGIYNDAFAIAAKATEGDSKPITDAIDRLKEGLALEAKIGNRNVHTAWSWIANPEEEDVYFSAVAQAMLQLQRPLNRLELQEMKEKLADPWVEFTGGLLFDYLNLLNIPAKLILAPKQFGAAQKVLSGLDNKTEIGSLFGMGIRKVVGDAFQAGGKSIVNALGLTDKIAEANLFQGGLIKKSTKAVAKGIVSSVDDLVSGLYGSPTVKISGTVGMTSDVFVSTAKQMAGWWAQGKSVDEVIELAMEIPELPAFLKTREKLSTLFSLTKIIDPLEQPGAFNKLFISANTEAVKDIATKIAVKYEKVIADTVGWNKLAATTGVKEIDDIITGALAAAKDGKETLGIVGDEIVKLATKQAGGLVTADQYGRKLGTLFAGIYKDAHTAWKGSSLMEDQLLGRLFKNSPAWQPIVNSAVKLQQKLFGNWLNNILYRLPKYSIGMQPAENYLSVGLSGTGVVGRIQQLFKNTDDLLDNLMELPLEARRGSIAITGEFEEIGGQLLAEFLQENRQAWKAGTNYITFWQESAKTKPGKWLLSELKKVGYDTPVKRAEFLAMAAQAKDDFVSFVDLVSEDGTKVAHIPLINGVPVQPTARMLKDKIWDSWAEAGKLTASANELVAKAWLAQERYLLDWQKVNGVALDEVMEKVSPILEKLKLPADLSTQVKFAISTNWQKSGGNAKKFADLMDDWLKGADSASSNFPQFIFKVPSGMTQQETSNFVMSVWDDFDKFTTNIKKSGREIVSADIDEFTANVLTDISKKVTDSLNPKGKYASTLFNLDEIPEPTAKDVMNAVDDGVPESVLSVAYPAAPKSTDKVAKLGSKTDTFYEELSPYRMWDEDEYAKKNTWDFVYPAFQENRKTTGELRGWLHNLELAVEKNPNDVALKAQRDFVKNSLDNADSMYGRMVGKGNFQSMVSPGYSQIKKGESETLDALREEMWIETGKRGKAALESDTEYKRKIIEWLKSPGVDAPRRTYGEWIESWGYVPVRTSGEPAFKLRDVDDLTILTDIDEEVAKRIRSDTYFHLKNNEVLDMPMDLPREELVRAQKGAYKPAPIISLTPEETAQHQQAFFGLFINKPVLKDKRSWKDIITPMLFGDEGMEVASKIDNMTPDDIIKGIRKWAKAHPDDAGAVATNIADELQHVMNYFTHKYLLDDAEYSIPVDFRSVPRNVSAWASHKVSTASQTAGIQNIMNEWQTWAKKELDAGTLFVKPPKVNASDLRPVIDDITTQLAQINETLWKGGKVSGFNLEGAIPAMKYRMRVMDENVIDQVAKSFIPFWGYATRGTRTWMRFALEHPNMVSAYYKYLRLSKMVSYSQGAVNSKGQQLPSMVGKIPINILGTGIWIDPMMPFPFLRYYLSPSNFTSFEEDDEDYTNEQKFIGWIRGTTQSFGFRLHPIADALLSALYNIDDTFTTQTPLEKVAFYGLTALIPTELVPPFLWKWADSLIGRSNGTTPFEDMRPQVDWHNYLVKEYLARTYLQKIRAEGDEIKRLKLVNELADAIDKREGNSIWDSALNSVKNGEFYRQLAGAMVGIYPKEFTSAQANLYAVRDSYNMYISAINNAVQAHIFFPDKTASDIYNLFKDKRYESAEGKLWNIRKIYSFASDPLTAAPMPIGADGKPMLDATSKAIQVELKTQEKYQLIANEYTKFNERMSTLPVGREYANEQAVQWRADMWRNILSFENDLWLLDAKKSWIPGIKPENIVYEHYADLWWQMLTIIMPKWDYDKGEGYDQYELRKQQWIAELPKYAAELTPIFNANILLGSLTAEDKNGLTGTLPKLLKETTPEGLRAWELRRDNAADAVMRVWSENYASKYWLELELVKGANTKEEFKRQWLERNPVPTAEVLTKWVKALYGNRFSDADIATVLTDATTKKQRDVLTPTEAQKVGNTDIENKWDAIWQIYSWASPGGSATLKKALVAAGGNPTDLENFVSAEGGARALNYIWDDPAKFESFYNAMIQAADMLQLKPPKGADLQLRLEAESLNNNFQQLITMQLGEGWEDIVNFYTFDLNSAEKKVWRTNNPDKYDNYILVYGQLKKQFAKENPVWAQFYTDTKQSGEYYSGGINWKAPTSQATVTSQKLFGAPLRSGVGIAQLGFSGEFSKVAGEWLLNELSLAASGSRKLSNAAITRLRNMQGIYPNLAREIEDIIKRYS